jgi:hypothetical protein
MDTAYRIDVIARMSVLYHRRRQLWLERWDTGAKVLAIFSSAAVLYSDKYQITALAVVVAVLTALVTMGVVVGGASRKAVLHSTLASRWSDVRADLARAGDDASELRKIQEKMAQISREEPPELGAQVRLCQIEVLRADGVPEAELPQVPWFHRWFAHWIDFNTPAPKAPPPA